jgi:hypothetical protein
LHTDTTKEINETAKELKERGVINASVVVNAGVI